MNLLAHIFLSGESDEIMIGNFIADFIRGNKFDHYSEDVIQGIHLHRKIDSYTDTHPIVKQSIQLLRDDFGKYASVIVDIFYDHFLASNFHDYSNIPLIDFSQEKYVTLSRNIDILPEKAQNFLPFMIESNWLLRYADFYGMERALTGLSRRSKFASNLHEAIHNLKKDYESFEKDFRLFFPDLMTFVEDELKKII